MKLILFILCSIFLYSCESPNGGSGNIENSSTSKSGTTYSLAVEFHSIHTGSKIHYECEALSCEISGEIYNMNIPNGYTNRYPFVTEISGILHLESDGSWSGQVSTSGYGSPINYNLKLNSDLSFKSIDDGSKCLNRTSSADKNRYEAELSKYTSSQTGQGPINFADSGATDISNCDNL